MAVADEDARHLVRRLRGAVEVRRHQEAGPALEDEVVDEEALAVERLRDANLQILGRLRPLAERAFQGFDARPLELLPVLPALQGVPLLAVLLVDRIAAGLEVAGQHLRQLFARFALGVEDWAEFAQRGGQVLFLLGRGR